MSVIFNGGGFTLQINRQGERKSNCRRLPGRHNLWILNRLMQKVLIEAEQLDVFLRQPQQDRR